MNQAATQMMDQSSKAPAKSFVKNLQTRGEVKWLEEVAAQSDAGVGALSQANAALKNLCKELINRLDKERERSLKLRRYVSRMSSTEAPAKTAKTIQSDMGALQNLVAEQSALLEKLYAENAELRETQEKITEHNLLLNTANDKLKQCNISLRRELKQLSAANLHEDQTTHSYEKIHCDEPSWLTSMIANIKTELETKRTLKQANESQERREKIRQKQKHVPTKINKASSPKKQEAEAWILKTE